LREGTPFRVERGLYSRMTAVGRSHEGHASSITTSTSATVSNVARAAARADARAVQAVSKRAGGVRRFTPGT
jgi:hypothetical protein